MNVLHDNYFDNGWDTFWSNCVEAKCIIVPVATYSQYDNDGNVSDEHFLGIKFAAFEAPDASVGPDYYIGMEEHHAGLKNLYNTPEEALAAYETKMLSFR